MCGWIQFLFAHPAQARELSPIISGPLFGDYYMMIVTILHLVKLLRNFTAHSLVIFFGNAFLFSQLGDARSELVSVFNGVEQHDLNRYIYIRTVC